MCPTTLSFTRPSSTSHTTLTSAATHLSVIKTLHNMQRYYYWPKMVDSIWDYISSCVECQRNKYSSQKKIGLLRPLHIPTRRFGSWSLDFMMPLPKTKQGYDGILVFVCRLSKLIRCFPVHTTITGEGVARLFMERMFPHFGLPDEFVSDRDPRFTGACWSELWRLNNTRLSMTVAHHAEGDGHAERANPTAPFRKCFAPL